MKYNQPSKYSSNWEPYVAANLYFYLVPLALFLRRARELDFSSKRFETSMTVVGRVLRLYSPELVQTLQKLLQAESQAAVNKHYENLQPFAPPQSVTLESLRPDLQKLLEEVFMERNKAARELGTLGRAFTKLERFVSGSNDEKVLEHALKQSRILGQWSEDFPSSSVLGSFQPSFATNAAIEDAPKRTMEGTLSNEGREEVLNGWVKCNPAEISLKGDPMRVGVRTHEVAFLVKLGIGLSDQLNEKCGFSEKSAFRFNLRFLADYRNLFSTLICCYILVRIIF